MLCWLTRAKWERSVCTWSMFSIDCVSFSGLQYWNGACRYSVLWSWLSLPGNWLLYLLDKRCEGTSLNLDCPTVYSCGTHGICSLQYISPPPTLYSHGISEVIYRGSIPWDTMIYRGGIPWGTLQMFPTVYYIPWGPDIYCGEVVVHGISTTI